MNRDEIKERLETLTKELIERKRNVPAHTIRPHQIIRIEELEEEIAELKSLLEKDG